MNRTPSGFSILPEAVHPMPYREAFRLNAWAGVAVLVAFVSRLLLRDPGWTGASRIALGLLPLVPAVLYLRTLARWMRSLDELQQRMQLEAVCFGALGMLLLALAADLLRASGYVPKLTFGWEGYFAFTFFLYALGLARVNRRYR